METFDHEPAVPVLEKDVSARSKPVTGSKLTRAKPAPQSASGDSLTSLVTNVYLQIRREILGGVLRPNQLLAEADIADRLGVSRMPVRESLQRLMGDGLVESRKRRWIVHEFTRSEVIEVYEIRSALEAAAAGLACQRATATQLMELRKISDSIAVAETRDAFIAACELFNRTVVSISGNERIGRMLRLNSVYYATHQLGSAYSRNDVDEFARRYSDICDAISSRDPSRAETMVRHYVNQSLKTLLERLFPRG